MLNELGAFLALFARMGGFFLLSPLFSYRFIPKSVLFGLALVTSLLLAPPLLQQSILEVETPLFLLTLLLKEVAIGYLIGLLFSFLFEAAVFAGQFVGTLTGFSATEILDPLSSNSHPLMGRVFLLLLFTLFFSLDFHHPLLRLLYESFSVFSFENEGVTSVIGAFSQLFSYALSYAIYPVTILIAYFLLVTLLSRHFSLFWISFPIQLILGFTAIAVAVGYFNQILVHNFAELFTLAKKLVLPVSF